MATNADLFLEIARDHLRQLNSADGPTVIGSEDSAHFHHAIVCSVFAAFAVEHVIAELIWARCFFQTPEPYRRAAIRSAERIRTVPQKLAFVRDTTGLDEGLRGRIKALFKYRNRHAHADVEPFEGRTFGDQGLDLLIDGGRGSDLDEAIVKAREGDESLFDALLEEFGSEQRSLYLPSLSTDDLDAAAKNLAVAEEAIEALRLELDSDAWPVVRVAGNDIDDA